MKIAFFSVLMGSLFVSLAHGALYQNAELGVSLQYNEKLWRWVDPASNPKTKLHQNTILSLERTEADKQYRPRFNIVSEPIQTTAQAAPDYLKKTVTFLKNFGFQSPTAQKASLPGVGPGNAVFEILDYHRHFGLTYHQYVVLKSGRAFLLTGAAGTPFFNERGKELRVLFDAFRLQTPTAKGKN